jgi:hypothetical protein
MAEQRMDIREWRRQRTQGIEVELPSGLVMRVKRVAVLDLVEQGLIPTSLVAAAEQFSSGGKVSLEELREGLGVINLVIKAAALSPRVVDEEVPADDTTRICINELDGNDKTALFNWLNAPAGELKAFLGGETKL